MISAWKLTYQEATFRKVFDVDITLLVPEACFLGNPVQVSLPGTTGTMTLTPVMLSV